MSKQPDIAIINYNANPNLQSLINKRKPFIIDNFQIGECYTKWTCDYLQKAIGHVNVKIHESTNPQMNFIKKNFIYTTLSMKDLIEKIETDHLKYYYLRSLGSDPRGQQVADIKKQFPEIAEDLNIPEIFSPEQFFSSVLRLSSTQLQLWTHYDIMDNVLIQVRGNKRVVLFPPDQALHLYLSGDKSRVLDIDSPDIDEFPLFIQIKRYECILKAGQILFIPAMWFHHVTSLEPGVAVNIFWKHLPDQFYDKKDPYGNKDLVPAARAIQSVEKAVKSLNVLPEEYEDFYIRRMITLLQDKLNNKK